MIANHVGDQTATYHPVERLQVDKGRRAHTYPVRLRGIVADDEIAQLPFGRLDRHSTAQNGDTYDRYYAADAGDAAIGGITGKR